MRRRGGTDRLLATVMFTDIVGSTELASELGDRGWKALLSRHNTIVRRELKRFAGRELDTAGDGFFVMFERPAQAIDCAWAIVDALRPLNLQMRAAIHMGEVEVMGSKIGGIAVHAASRLLSIAGPSQILVTGIVHDVVAGSDIVFADRGLHELRGVPGEWRVFAVEETARDRALPVEPLPEGTAARPSWAPVAIATAVVGAALVAGIIAVVANAPAAAPIVPRANSVVHVDAASDALRHLVEIEDPTGIVVADGAVWVLSLGARTLNRIDGATQVVVPVGLPAAPTGIASAKGAIWITTGFGTASGSGGVLRVGSTSRRVEGMIPLADGVHGIVGADEALWVTNRIRRSLVRIDLTTETVAAEAEAGEQPEAVAYGDGSVWVASGVDRMIGRYEPVSLASVSQVALADPPTAIALGFGRLWIASSTGNSVTIVDAATNARLQTIDMPGSPRGIAIGPDGVWVAVASGELVRIDPQDPASIRRIELAGAPDSVAAGESGVWVSIRE
jgi:YVTN family beta-propeller protein